MSAIARVLINLKLDRAFDYAIPNHLIGKVNIGSQVEVPFNKGVLAGYVVAMPSHSKFPKLREILDVKSKQPLLSDALLKLGDWMADYYCCAREKALESLLPGVIRSERVKAKQQLMIELVEDLNMDELLPKYESGRSKIQAQILRRLHLLGAQSRKELTQLSGGASSAITALRKKGLIHVREQAVNRNPFLASKVLPDSPKSLTEEQQKALDAICSNLVSDLKKPILLHGVTGSGKTEVYLQAMADCLEQGKNAIMLVPEISLTPQTTDRFRARFGDSVSVLHSHLSDGERFDEWHRINKGEVNIVVGARSALFAPFKNLGLIIVDEAHENSYKQSEISPRYHASDVAVMRGKFEDATVILGTATPSLEAYRNAIEDRYEYIEMTKRVDHAQLPHIELVDMVTEKDKIGQAQIISKTLEEEIRHALNQGDQIILFLNRRGYATQLQCLSCGYVAECEQCSVKYTYHRENEMLICHTCGDVHKAPRACPSCKDEQIRFSGLGTQKIESIIHGIFPEARVLRMDSDTMTTKDSYSKTLSEFKSNGADILIGTQMIAKGLDFPSVTLVGVIFADLSLHIPDFRAAEKTFQLLVQVAGRAGRGELPGKVLVQTYTPYNPALQAVKAMDLKGFYKEELDMRQAANFPPFRRSIAIRCSGEVESEVAKQLQILTDLLLRDFSHAGDIIGPLPSGLLKRRNRFYYHSLIFTDKTLLFSRALKHYLKQIKLPKQYYFEVDVDPIYLT